MAHPIGRFAPTPSGRMHLGNVMCALVAWLSVRKQNGTFLLRIEDLDRPRCANRANIDWIKRDLEWLGITYDNPCDESSYQSNRYELYEQALETLKSKGLLYPCYCSRDELHVPSAPHAQDGQILYQNTCRKYLDPALPRPTHKTPSIRIAVPNRAIAFQDGIQGSYEQNLLTECSDFILKRSDHIYSYQLAVVVDDALSSVTEVMRGCDLLSSTPRQIWLYQLLGYPVPSFFHLPLLLSPNGARLSKRDFATDMGFLRQNFNTPHKIIGLLAFSLGLLEKAEPISPQDLIPYFFVKKIPKTNGISLPQEPIF